MENNSKPFDEERLTALRELGEALRVAHNRLIAEGYTIVDGKYVPPKKNQN